MKIRKGFVSNSSSSSFIVVHEKGGLEIPDLTDFLNDLGVLEIDGSEGENEFGWQNNTYRDFWSKVNFCYMQARDVKNQEWITMLEEVIKELEKCLKKKTKKEY